MMGSPLAKWIDPRRQRWREIGISLVSWAIGLMTGLVIMSSSRTW